MQNSSWLWKKSYLEPSDDQWNPGSAGGKCWRPKELRNSLVIAGKKSEVGHKPNPQCIPTLRKPSKEGRSPSLPYKHGCGSWQGCKYNIFYSPISVLSFTVLVFYLVSNSQEFVAEPITVRKMHKDHVNTDLTSRAHLTASGFQWSCGDLLSCHWDRKSSARWVTTQPTEEPVILKSRHEKVVFLAEIFISCGKWEMWDGSTTTVSLQNSSQTRRTNLNGGIVVLNKKGWPEIRLVSYGKIVGSFYRICSSSWHCNHVSHSACKTLPASVFVLGCTFQRCPFPWMCFPRAQMGGDLICAGSVQHLILGLWPQSHATALK